MFDDLLSREPVRTCSLASPRSLFWASTMRQDWHAACIVTSSHLSRELFSDFLYLCVCVCLRRLRFIACTKWMCFAIIFSVAIFCYDFFCFSCFLISFRRHLRVTCTFSFLLDACNDAFGHWAKASPLACFLHFYPVFAKRNSRSNHFWSFNLLSTVIEYAMAIRFDVTAQMEYRIDLGTSTRYI